MNTFSKKEAFLVGWDRFRERPIFVIGLFIITTIISVFTGFVADKVEGGGISILLNALDFAVQLILGMGITLILLRLHDNIDTDYIDLLEPIRMFWKYTLMTILVMLIIFFGLILFIIPGIIAVLALSFAPYAMIDRNLGPIESIKESIEITNGHKWNLLIFGFLVAIVNMIGSLLLGIGLLITIPVTALAAVHVYRWITDPSEKEGIEVSIFTKILSTLGGIIIIGVTLFVLVFFNGFNSINGISRDAQRTNDLSDIRQNASRYRDATGRYPTSLNDLYTQNDIPLDPKTGEVYRYTVFGEGADYEICAKMEMQKDFNGYTCEFGLELGEVPVKDAKDL